ncbi:MAG TPA: GNAT family N-acetyltransferase [Pyrinomonadaceae bacterium]|jgi:GNAT superfamily N-acetyltransferase|nr:GNAT family N-acetyltransferase [Pyrinomonadaceae bacterium]
MIIRRALPDEAATLTRIALDAQRYWGYPEHWIKHFEPDLTISSEFIHENQVYVAEEDGEIRGFYALRVTGNKAELEQLWVMPAHIGTGIGKEMVLDVYEKISATDERGLLSHG